MAFDIPGRTLWELFITLHPVLMEAFPRPEKMSDLVNRNNIDKIRQEIRAIPRTLPDGPMDRNKLDHHEFSQSLQSLLNVFDTLVSDDVAKRYAIQRYDDDINQPEQIKLQDMFPNLTRISNALSTINMVTGISSSTSKRRRNALRELAGHIDPFDPERYDQNRAPEVAERLREFRYIVNKHLADPMEELEQDIRYATSLKHEETTFILRATKLNAVSCRLHSLLADSISCSSPHKAQLYLSGFLSLDVDFELLVEDCEENRWNHANCKWDSASVKTATLCDADRLVCSHKIRQTDSGPICLSFNEKGLWIDETRDGGVCKTGFLNQHPTLQQLITGNHHNSDIMRQITKREKYVLELLIACSLLNLDTSHWIRAGLSTGGISLERSETADLLARIKPHITCALTTAPDEYGEDSAIISFGILLMEMESNQIATAKEEDRDWDSGDFSQDTILQRILKDWTEDVDDGFRKIAWCCLKFQELSKKFYDRDLEHNENRTGAMYKYILAPLFRLVTHNFGQALEIFKGIPKPDGIQFARSNKGHIRSHKLKLFDGHSVKQVTQEDIARAEAFMCKIGEFAKTIEDSYEESYESSSAINFEEYRAKKIRIAVLDTGIDKNDTLVRASLRRIKECRGFVDSPTDYEDNHSHGTHVARLILTTAPLAEIFVAKISDESTIEAPDLHRIAQAIKWAIEKKVNIISMSLGLEEQNIDIEEAIHEAESERITIFAASSNDGGNRSRAWPANRSSGTICIHASDGMGNDGGISPTPRKETHNFTTLGIAIPSRWKGKAQHISGTSFSTPIAAALASNVLEFARHRCNLRRFQEQKLCRYEGITRILRLMVEEGTENRGGYHYISPSHLWGPGRRDEDVAELIRKIAST